MKVKAKQVAKDLGISEATVSLAVNNRPGVNDETKKRVLDYIEKSKQQELQSIAEKSIKVLFYVRERALYDEEKANLFSLSYMEIYRVVKNAGLNLKLVHISDEKEVLEAIDMSYKDGTVGILLYASDLEEEGFRPFRNITIPLMVNDNVYEDMMADCVFSNNRQGIRLAMNYLYSMGHRDIMYFYNTNTIHIFQQRREAYLMFSREKAVGMPEDSMLEVGTKIEVIYDNVLRYIKGGGRMPTAILSENYAISIGTIKALQDCGYNIPEDISIIGIDELPSYALLDFKLSYINVLHVSKVNIAITRLIQRIQEGPKETVQIVVGNEFVEGNSVRKIN